MRTRLGSRALRAVEAPARQNAFGSILIQGSQRLSRLVAIIAAAAVLAPDSFADLAVAVALTDLVRGGLLAFDVGAIRLLARGDDSTYVVRTNLDAKVVVGMLALSLIAALSIAVYGPTTIFLVVISGIGVLAASLASTFLVLRQAALSLRPISPRVVGANIVGTVLAVILLWLTRSPVGVVAGLAIGDIVSLQLVSGGYRWHRPAAWAAIALTRDRGRLLVMQLAYIGQFRMGTIVLAAAGTAVAVGEYAIASRIAEGLVILASALTASTLPMMGGAFARGDRVGLASLFGRSYRLGLSAIAPLLAILVVVAPIWIGILFPRYPDAGPSFAIVGLAVIIFFASSQTTALLNAAHLDRAASRSSVAGLGVSVLGSILLVPLGAVGVAWARVAGELVRLLSEGAAAIRDLGVRPSSLVRPWLAIAPILAAAAVVVVEGWQAPWIWVAGLVVLAGAGWLVAADRLIGGRPA